MRKHSNKKRKEAAAEMVQLLDMAQQAAEFLRAPLREGIVVPSPLGWYELQLRNMSSEPANQF